MILVAFACFTLALNSLLLGSCLLLLLLAHLFMLALARGVSERSEAERGRAKRGLFLKLDGYVYRKSALRAGLRTRSAALRSRGLAPLRCARSLHKQEQAQTNAQAKAKASTKQAKTNLKHK